VDEETQIGRSCGHRAGKTNPNDYVETRKKRNTRIEGKEKDNTQKKKKKKRRAGAQRKGKRFFFRARWRTQQAAANGGKAGATKQKEKVDNCFGSEKATK